MHELVYKICVDSENNNFLNDTQFTHNPLKSMTSSCNMPLLCCYQTMKSMGLRSRVNWLAWFVSSYLVMALLCIIIVLFLKLGNIFPHSDWGVVIIYFLLFAFSTLMLR